MTAERRRGRIEGSRSEIINRMVTDDILPDEPASPAEVARAAREYVIKPLVSSTLIPLVQHFSGLDDYPVEFQVEIAGEKYSTVEIEALAMEFVARSAGIAWLGATTAKEREESALVLGFVLAWKLLPRQRTAAEKRLFRRGAQRSVLQAAQKRRVVDGYIELRWLQRKPRMTENSFASGLAREPFYRYLLQRFGSGPTTASGIRKRVRKLSRHC